VANEWPWLAVAGVGALHGLNPATGWLVVAASGLRSGDRRQAWRGLLPIGIGHAASIALLAGAMAAGVALDRSAIQLVAGALLLVVAAIHLRRRAVSRRRASARNAGLALWSFMAASAHGAGLMLVPALIPICLGDPSSRPIGVAGALLPALAAVALHGAAMLAVTGAIAAGACGGVGALRRAWPSHRPAPSTLAAVPAEAAAAGVFRNAMAAALNISTAPNPSAQPKRSDRATTPTPTAITGLTKA
jgi:hypothetical protein